MDVVNVSSLFSLKIPQQNKFKNRKIMRMNSAGKDKDMATKVKKCLCYIFIRYSDINCKIFCFKCNTQIAKKMENKFKLHPLKKSNSTSCSCKKKLSKTIMTLINPP